MPARQNPITWNRIRSKVDYFIDFIEMGRSHAPTEHQSISHRIEFSQSVFCCCCWQFVSIANAPPMCDDATESKDTGPLSARINCRRNYYSAPKLIWRLTCRRSSRRHRRWTMSIKCSVIEWLQREARATNKIMPSIKMLHCSAAPWQFVRVLFFFFFLITIA